MTPDSEPRTKSRPGDPPRISLCVIVKNEEKDLGACLESARGAFDEAIVIDTGSMDRTREVAAKAGAHVVEFPWRDDFAAARNCSLEHAGGDWILVLDADERLDTAAAERIRAAVADKTALAYRLEIVSGVGKELPQRTWLVRLFRRHPKIRYVRRIHESVNEAIVALTRVMGQRVLDLNVEIQHSGYVPERFASLKKRERNLRLHHLTVADRPGDAYAWYRFGDELRAVDSSEAKGALTRAWSLLLEIPLAERPHHVYGPEIPAVLALLTLESGDAEAAARIVDEGGAIVGWTPNLHYVKALILRKLGDHRGAIGEYQWLLDFHGRRTEAPVQPGITSTLAHVGQAEAHEAMGDLTACEASLRRALALDPKGSKVARELARVVSKGGRTKEARQELDEYLKRVPNDGEAWALSARFALAAGSPEAAVKRYQIAASAFDAPDWVLRELAECKAMVGDLTGVLSTLERVKEGVGALAGKRPVSKVPTAGS